MTRLLHLVNGVAKTWFFFPCVTLPLPSLVPLNCILVGLGTAAPEHQPGVPDANFEALVVPNTADNLCTVAVNEHTGGSAAEASENAGSASLAAAASTDKSVVVKDVRVAVGETADLVAADLADLDAAATVEVLHAGMKIAEAVVYHAAQPNPVVVHLVYQIHTAELPDLVVSLFLAELDDLDRQMVQESEQALAWVEDQLAAEAVGQ